MEIVWNSSNYKKSIQEVSQPSRPNSIFLVTKLQYHENKFEAIIIKSFHLKKVTKFLSPLSTLQMLDKVNTLKAC